ncbi:MAG: hypothetical protein P9M00_01985 [Candidatus Tritonobacter lacicola]|nr:hypothetical protein [Candidatus Tritonobacter lacicola]
MRKVVLIVSAVVLISAALFLYVRMGRRTGEDVQPGAGVLMERYRSAPDSREREEIVELLGEEDSDVAVASLSEIARSGDGKSSLLAVEKLARSPKEQSADAVAGFIGSRRPVSARWQAAREAGAGGGAELGRALAALLLEGEPRAKIMAIFAMKGIHDRTQDDALGKVLADEGIPSLSEMARTYLDPQIQRDSWETLGYVDPVLALSLYEGQEKMSPAVEERVVLSLGRNGGENVAAGAVAFFDGAGSERKKISACRIIGLIGGRNPGGPAEDFMKKRGLPFIREAAAGRGGNDRLRKLAIAALGESGDSECLPLLKELAAEYPRDAGRAIEKIRSRGYDKIKYQKSNIKNTN